MCYYSYVTSQCAINTCYYPHLNFTHMHTLSFFTPYKQGLLKCVQIAKPYIFFDIGPFYFFLLNIQLFSHLIGNFIFTFCPFTPGLIEFIASFVSMS